MSFIRALFSSSRKMCHIIFRYRRLLGSITRIDGETGDLLSAAKAKMRPRLARIGGFVHPVTDCQIRPGQPLAA